jgi:putative two-component system response regulator
MPHDQAAKIIAEGSGQHFDPDVVSAFLEIQDSFVAIARAYADSDADLQKKSEYLEVARDQVQG